VLSRRDGKDSLAMPLDDLHVQLDAFEGPLDLLLFLIRREEVDITDIPISRMTEQFMTSLKAGGIDRIDIEVAGEFLVMAATLMEIKSRMLVPTPTAGTAAATTEQAVTAEDPRALLVQQLMAYKKYRDAAHQLDRRLGEWSRRFPGGGAAVADVPEPEDADQTVDIEDLDLMELAQAFTRIMETVDFARVGEHRVIDDETPIALHAEDLMDRLRRDAGAEGVLEFRSIFAGRTKTEAIGLFLAMLELIRQRLVVARQDKLTDLITVRIRQPDDA